MGKSYGQFASAVYCFEAGLKPFIKTRTYMQPD